MSRELPRLADAPAAAAWLLGGREGRKPEPWLVEAGEGASFVRFLEARRLAGEVAGLPALAEAGFPATARRALAIHGARLNAAWAARAETLACCARALAAKGIPVLAYKGAAILELTHGDPSRRPMSDLDLLVRARDRQGAVEALRAAGLQPTDFDTRLHAVLMDPRSRGPALPQGVAVELHGDVFPPPHPFRIDLDEVFAAARPSRIEGLLLPSRGHAIVLSAFHVALYENEGGKGLATLRDVALLACAMDERDACDAVIDVATRWELRAVVAEIGRRAFAWAGAPTWTALLPGGHASARTRRSLALRLALAEMDSHVTSADAQTGPRSLSRRLSAALWPDHLTRSAAALWQGLAGASGEVSGVRHAMQVVRRHVAAMARSRPHVDRAVP